MAEDGNGKTCLVQPGHRSVDQLEQHDFRLQLPRPGSAPSIENPKKIFRICDPMGWNRSTGRARSGLMDIYNFPGVIYAKDGSKGSTGMGADFYRHDTKGGGCCRVGALPDEPITTRSQTNHT